MTDQSLIGTHKIQGKEELSVLASNISLQLQPGDVVLLTGDLGAGKTTFTQYVGKALGVEETITSPTYTLVGEYPTVGNAVILSLIHIDMYRTGDTSAPQASVLSDTYIQEIINGAKQVGAVVVVEWGELLKVDSKNRVWRILLKTGEHDNERVITIRT